MPIHTRRDRDPFGRIMPEPQPDPEILNFRKPFNITRPVGMWGKNRRRDVAKIENLLGLAGVLDLSQTDGATGYFGMRVDHAIRRFQEGQGLRRDGLISPRGETLKRLRETASAVKPNDAGSGGFRGRQKKAPLKRKSPPSPKPPILPSRPGETRDPMDTRAPVPGTLDQNEIRDIRRLLRKPHERRT